MMCAEVNVAPPIRCRYVPLDPVAPDAGVVQCTRPERRRYTPRADDVRCGVDLERGGRANIHDTRTLVPMVLAGHVRGGNHVAMVVDALWDRLLECRALSACVTRVLNLWLLLFAVSLASASATIANER